MQILGEIHSSLTMNLRPCSWATIFDYRDSYVGSVPHVVRGLMYQQAQKESQQMAYAYSTPVTAPPAYALGPHEVYPTVYHHPYHQYQHQHHHHHHMQQQQQQTRPVYAYSYQAEHRGHATTSAYLPKTLPGLEMPVNSTVPQPLSTTKSNHRAEEPKQSSHTVREPFEVWNNNNNGAPVMKSVPKFDSLLDIDRLEQLCYDEVDTRQSKAEIKMTTSSKETHRTRNHTKETTTTTAMSSSKSQIVINPVSEKTSRVATKTAVASTTGARPKENSHPPSNGTAAVNQSKATASSKQNGWECLFCTFCNASDREICEMCAKSRSRGPESRPLHRGGRECSNCTLVNPPDEETCAACSTSLVHAPTYI